MGNGIKVCILDTGIDLNHADFAGRTMVTASFIPGETVQDGHSHGTHTAGTACGPLKPAGAVPRYGIAYGASLYIGKSLPNSGRGTDGTVLAGMNWAIANKCEVVSMSIGARETAQTLYTKAGQKALDNGLLFIAASGNDSARPGTIATTGAPGNSPTIMAVGGVDSNLDMYVKSNGGKVEIAGPGVGVLSSIPGSLYGNKTGTSMATPHVSGIAALWAETDSTLRGQASMGQTGGDGEGGSVSRHRRGHGRSAGSDHARGIDTVNRGGTEQEWIVTIDANTTLEAVEKELKRVGFAIVRVFDQLGGLEVRGPEKLVDKAKSLPGVTDIAKSGIVDIGPPGALDS